MEQDKQIRKILDEKLHNNDINIIDMIMDYTYDRCFICWRYSPDTMKSYCDKQSYPQIYMLICCHCRDAFKFFK